ncbi:U3 small nucleolar RNA-associated protein [Rhizoctonia solani]|uniref:U3 small nucleolar RNA-associated protein n=1 Tax=Rhizoctonia solani TaxID=456999 RepID=A0A8H8NMY6_9AGAM|nr:U3 small nucleolar RNA-associated protein [Rhizoctonia solani]QRW16255.1 U3 small nucleolar RNA-associated protein [Rhizoctonia solani]
MTQNIHNAVIYLGHQNGTVALHTPSTPTPRSPTGPSGPDNIPQCGPQLWGNWKGCVREWTVRGGAPSEVEWSRKGGLVLLVEDLSIIVVPGSGEANIDSFEDGVFENKKARQEREVRSLLDKLQPDMITLDPEFMGRLAEPGHVPFATPELPFRQKPRLDRLRDLGKADESPVSEEEGGDVNADEGGEQASRPKEKDK